jgi:hypothetical protein
MSRATSHSVLARVSDAPPPPELHVLYTLVSHVSVLGMMRRCGAVFHPGAPSGGGVMGNQPIGCDVAFSWSPECLPYQNTFQEPPQTMGPGADSGQSEYSSPAMHPFYNVTDDEVRHFLVGMASCHHVTDDEICGASPLLPCAMIDGRRPARNKRRPAAAHRQSRPRQG